MANQKNGEEAMYRLVTTENSAGARLPTNKNNEYLSAAEQESGAARENGNAGHAVVRRVNVIGAPLKPPRFGTLCFARDPLFALLRTNRLRQRHPASVISREKQFTICRT